MKIYTAISMYVIIRMILLGFSTYKCTKWSGER